MGINIYPGLTVEVYFLAGNAFLEAEKSTAVKSCLI